jgi:hypothetical protein
MRREPASWPRVEAGDRRSCSRGAPGRQAAADPDYPRPVMRSLSLRERGLAVPSQPAGAQAFPLLQGEW